ncbi:MAG: Xaa-Pro peptidase family protein [Planctomycetaceae bacterium]
MPKTSTTKSSSSRYAQRRDKLLKLLQEENIPGMLVTAEVNVSYLTGFTGDSSYLLLTKDAVIIVSDSRYTTQLEEECPGIDLYIRKVTEQLPEAIVKATGKLKLSKLAYEDSRLVVSTYQKLSAELQGVELVGKGGMIESKLRSIKDAMEIAETREAVRLAEKGLEVLRAVLTPEMTELEAAWELERTIRRFGGRGMAFPPIVGVGDRAALPHYYPQQYQIREAPLVLVDWGAETFSRYRSDITRTLFTGKPTKKMADVYRVVLEAQELAIAGIRPGARCSDIDSLARQHIAKCGYGKYFGHGLGHGIGLEIHEQPRFSPTSEDVLQPGMIVTVEPGIYLAGRGGVRIEDDILVTTEGHEVLSTTPKDFESMCLVGGA